MMRLRNSFSVAALIAAAVLGITLSSCESDGAVIRAVQVSSPGAMASGRTRSGQSALPALPNGTRTVLGGQIENVNPVTDEFTLRIPGGQKVKVFYDVRTRFYEDGAERSVLDLHHAAHASVETTLDGTKIFAVSIHVLSESPTGTIHGQVIQYDRQRGILTVRSDLTGGAVHLQVPSGTAIVAKGQIQSSDASQDLMPGSVIEAVFKPGRKGQGIATEIDVLAYPGAQIVFQGRILFVNLQSGRLTLVDAADHREYNVTFQPQGFSGAAALREGANVKIDAVFNGRQYVAQSVSPLP